MKKLTEKGLARIEKKYKTEIVRRGGETEIIGQYENKQLAITDSKRVHGRRLYLLRTEGWRQYSRSFGARKAQLAYLCGHDDNGVWAVRVKGTCKTVTDALDFIEPVAVKQARAAGRKILRQGDVYIVEVKKDNPTSIGETSLWDYSYDGRVWVPAHEWFSKARILIHNVANDANIPEIKHAPLHIPFPCRMYRQHAYEMGRSGRRDDAD